VSAACASAAAAVGLAADQILLGRAEWVLAGGAEAPLHELCVKQLLAAGVLGSHPDPRLACRPFDVSRNGTVLGEGAAFLVLESLASARRRGARVHARLAGWAAGADGRHCTAPREDGQGLLRVMQQALARAGATPSRLDYINAHGTGTRRNDPLEVVALRGLLGERLAAVPCSSTKPVTGHCLGAAAAVEAVVCVLALQRQTVPPTAACDRSDPECPIDVVPGEARPAPLRLVMSNSLGFWGNNAALVFSRLETG
jgi:3-oxoacyl-(acyl-carrier-protein) synthase